MASDTKEVSKIVLYNGDKFLLLQKPNGKWQLPGGHIKTKETPQNGLARELKEETGITQYTAKLLKTFDNNYLFTGNTDITKVLLSFEHKYYRWVTKKEALSLNLTKDTTQYLKYV